jgi:hypothetical protein
MLKVGIGDVVMFDAGAWHLNHKLHIVAAVLAGEGTSWNISVF